MQNYHTDLVWKLDFVAIIIFIFLFFYVIFCLFIQEHKARIRKKKLLNLKNDIYEMLVSGESKNACLSQPGKISTQEFLDVVTNRNRAATFFNEEEQKYFKKCFINQSNILKIERFARKSKNKWRRIEAILALGYSGASSALDIFEKGLFSKDDDTSYFSLLALGQIKTVLSARILLAFLKKNALMRLKVASLLETFPPFVADEIIKLINDNDPTVRFWAIKILSRLKPSKYIEDIKNLVNDTSGNVRAVACECLGAIGGNEAERILINCLKDEFWFVRVCSARALNKSLGSKCVKHIVGLLNDSSLNVAEAAKEILIQNIDVSMSYLEKIIMHGDESTIKMSIEVITTSGYVEKIVKEVLTKNSPPDSSQMIILFALIRGGANYSVEAALSNLNMQERELMVKKIKDIDSVFAKYVMEKLEGKLKEV